MKEVPYYEKSQLIDKCNDARKASGQTESWSLFTHFSIEQFADISGMPISNNGRW